ncbi:hypothetical protein GCM10010207_74340 [Streptomyces atratus]|uniref:hypothetical protein n=1 Tax=Streptomyces atratus TaxID=1893 RepID=UPI001670C846|nr:hypothetical protein [Streptomyces atratus]GGT64251.1 hypothetical protein GCM10010207_74340 [Streptomyces atratus]
MGDVFSADVSRIRQWQNLMRDITDITDSAVRDFEAEARSCLDWVGRDDSMAEDLRPRDQKERKDTTETGTSLMQAIAGISTALRVNGNVIQGAQNNASEAINDESSKSGKH